MSTKVEFKTKLVGLVEQFERNELYYKSKSYKENEVRQEFINPFFKAFGWDMENTSNVAPQYRDVIHEDRIEIEGKPKAPDYSFKVGPERKFFVEAKASSVKIVSEFPPSFQLRRYAWSGKLPISLLTDFEEFSVYDTTIEPRQSDRVETARIKYIHYKDYLEEADYLWDTFSKEAVWQGSFDKFAQTAKRGTELVDKKFLNEIETWRSILAKDIATNNQNIDIYQLNDAIQKTIDRIIFFRIAEDRGIEFYETLKQTIRSKDTYSKLIQIFKRAHEKYNSNLFDFEEDKLTLKLKISDEILDKIISGLYYPKSPYEFSVIGVEILGSVYEQFLGKVIRLTKNHTAVIEEKPEVKKAGGVYYTPQYIVDYIVKNIVGELVKAKTPTQVSKIKIVDPACGSGSFLIGAYDFLLDWHLKYYIENNPGKYLKSKALFIDREGNYLLSSAEKKKILINNIYGVDIDAQAVEVTKLSLALKMLENENRDTLKAQLNMFTDRILPDLSTNIKWGNSLIGTDYYNDKNLTLFNDEEIRKVNAFDWEKEFVQVFKQGGFDAVIGNPPYVRQESLGEFKNYFENHYETYHGMADLYVYFIEKSLKLLNKDGIYGVIVANKWMRAGYGESLREYLQKQNLKKLIDFGDLPVFGKVSAYPCILISKTSNSKDKNNQFEIATLKDLDFTSLADAVDKIAEKAKIDSLNKEGWSLVSSKEQELMDKLKKVGIPLKEYVDGKIYRGVLTGLNEAFVINGETKERLIKEDPKSAEVIKPFLEGKDIKRYIESAIKKYLIIFPKGSTNSHNSGKFKPVEWLKNTYPAIYDHLVNFQQKAEKRYDKGDYWWELRACDYYEEFEKAKIIYPNISKKSEFTFDSNGLYTNQKCFIISTSDRYLLGLLNSSLANSWYKINLPKLRGGFFEPNRVVFVNFPVKIPHDKGRNKIELLVSQILETQKQLHLGDIGEGQKKLLEQRIQNLDKQIDELVYELYGLNKEGIDLIEGSTGKVNKFQF